MLVSLKKIKNNKIIKFRYKIFCVLITCVVYSTVDTIYMYSIQYTV